MRRRYLKEPAKLHPGQVALALLVVAALTVVLAALADVAGLSRTQTKVAMVVWIAVVAAILVPRLPFKNRR
jgi:MFS-type transporter involved in bile tolerance (Atg22 family)